MSKYDTKLVGGYEDKNPDGDFGLYFADYKDGDKMKMISYFSDSWEDAEARLEEIKKTGKAKSDNIITYHYNGEDVEIEYESRDNIEDDLKALAISGKVEGKCVQTIAVTKLEVPFWRYIVMPIYIRFKNLFNRVSAN